VVRSTAFYVTASKPVNVAGKWPEKWIRLTLYLIYHPRLKMETKLHLATEGVPSLVGLYFPHQTVHRLPVLLCEKNRHSHFKKGKRNQT